MCRGEKSRKNGYIKVSDKVSGKVLLHAYLEITEFHFNTGAENRQKKRMCQKQAFRQNTSLCLSQTHRHRAVVACTVLTYRFSKRTKALGPERSQDNCCSIEALKLRSETPSARRHHGLDDDQSET